MPEAWRESPGSAPPNPPGLPCGESPCYGMPRLKATERERHGMQVGCRVSGDPDLRLADDLPEVIRHVRGPGFRCSPHDKRHRPCPRAGPWARPAWIRACTPPGCLAGAGCAAGPGRTGRGGDDKSPPDAWLDSRAGRPVPEDADVSVMPLWWVSCGYMRMLC